MDTASSKTDTVSTIDSTIQVLRICTEKSLYDADDLVAEMLVVRTRMNHAAIAIQLAEAFVRDACAAGTDAGLAVLGNDLLKACRAARGIQSVQEHYEAMARDAQQAVA